MLTTKFVHPMNGAQMKAQSRAILTWSSILTLGVFLSGCEQRYAQPPPPPEIHDDDKAVKETSILLEKAESTHQWTPEQATQFSHNLSGLSGKTRLELTLRLVNLINAQKVKRVPAKSDPEPPVICPAPCTASSGQDNPPAGGTRPVQPSKRAH